MTGEPIATFLRSFRFRFQSETELQDGIARALTEARFDYKREHQLSRWDRPDFLIGHVAVEVKIDGSRNNLIRQLHRYAEFEEIRGIIVVTNRSRLGDLPPTLNGKALHLVLLRSF